MKPLLGYTVLVTRPVEQAQSLLKLLHQAGANPVLFSPIEICPDTVALMQLNAPFLSTDIVFFVSPSAIDLAAPVLDFSSFSGCLVCVGKASALRLQQYTALPVRFPKEGNDSEAVLQMDLWHDVAGKRVLIIKGEGGRRFLQARLQQKGAVVQCVNIYRRQEQELDWDNCYNLIKGHENSVVYVTSSEIAHTLFRQAPQKVKKLLKSLLYLTPHRRISISLEQLGVKNVVTCQPGDENMVQSLITFLKPI